MRPQLIELMAGLGIEIHGLGTGFLVLTDTYKLKIKFDPRQTNTVSIYKSHSLMGIDWILLGVFSVNEKDYWTYYAQQQYDEMLRRIESQCS